MREPYGEGPASHTGPESCVVGRNAQGEALALVPRLPLGDRGSPKLCFGRGAKRELRRGCVPKLGTRLACGEAIVCPEPCKGVIA